MDISMPIMDGYEATRRIREYESQIKLKYDRIKKSHIIGLTAHSTDSYKNRCFAVGMDDFSNQKLIMM